MEIEAYHLVREDYKIFVNIWNDKSTVSYSHAVFVMADGTERHIITPGRGAGWFERRDLAHIRT